MICNPGRRGERDDRDGQDGDGVIETGPRRYLREDAPQRRFRELAGDEKVMRHGCPSSVVRRQLSLLSAQLTTDNGRRTKTLRQRQHAHVEAALVVGADDEGVVA